MLPWSKRRPDLPFPKDTPLQSVRYVVLDTELTSLDNRTNRLLSVGAIAMNGARILMGEQFYRVANPGVVVPEQSIVIHKLRPADIQNGEPMGKVLADLQGFIAGAVLVGHFAEIDMKVLRKELAALGSELANPALCTARIQRWIVQKQRYSEDQFHRLEQVNLAALAKLYKIEVAEAHHALDDAFVTARLWQKMTYEVEKLGVTTIGQLLKIGGL